MAILVTKSSRVIVQGITGGAGSSHTLRMLNYGTQIVAGTSPGKGGEQVHGVPVYDTVRECVERQQADTSVIFLPARFVLEAGIEAVRAGIKLVVVVPEHIPIADMLRLRQEAQACGARILGGNRYIDLRLCGFYGNLADHVPISIDGNKRHLGADRFLQAIERYNRLHFVYQLDSRTRPTDGSARGVAHRIIMTVTNGKLPCCTGMDRKLALPLLLEVHLDIRWVG